MEFLHRHARAAWGELCDEDRELNDAAVECSRIVSAYRTKAGTKICIITEAADDGGRGGVKMRSALRISFFVRGW